MHSFNAEAVERSLASVARELTEAKVRANAHEAGSELRSLIRHARGLHDLLRAQIAAGDPWVVETLRKICDEMGLDLRRLEILIDGPLADDAPH